MKTELWEILVPASGNNDKDFSYEHHKQWDEFVKNLTGGVTIMKTAKGQWVSPHGQLYIDRMIPCRIICTKPQISQIIDFTIAHYDQEAVLAYKVSSVVILKHKRTEPYRPVEYKQVGENLYENIKCKLNIVPEFCGRQKTCTGCPNLNE